MNYGGARFRDIDHKMGRKPWANALRLISRNALASDSARLTIDAGLDQRFEFFDVSKITDSSLDGHPATKRKSHTHSSCDSFIVNSQDCRCLNLLPASVGCQQDITIRFDDASCRNDNTELCPEGCVLNRECDWEFVPFVAAHFDETHFFHRQF